MAKENNKSPSKRSEEKSPMRQEEPARDFFNRLLEDDFLPESFNLFRTPRLLSRLGRQWFPRVDVSETDKEVKVVADIPGVDPNNIEIEVRDNRIRISGTTQRENRSDERPYRYERLYGEFRREFMLPTRVKEDEVKAVYRDGVLTITIPKAEGEQRKKINIEKQ